jgi:peptidoglycan/LPS O-acetylase OafA/YrhL
VGTWISTKFQELGDASYALYLIHPTVIVSLVNIVPFEVPLGGSAFLIILVVSLVLNSYISIMINRHVQPYLS